MSKSCFQSLGISETLKKVLVLTTFDQSRSRQESWSRQPLLFLVSESFTSQKNKKFPVLDKFDESRPL